MEQGKQDKRPPLSGRRRITSDLREVGRGTVVAALKEALPSFWLNRAECERLWRYYKGIQPVLGREKGVRPEINNAIVENHAQEIVAFKVGYQLAEPLQYTCRMDGPEGSYAGKLAQVNELNAMMFAEDKASCDRDLFEWMCICGVGYRMVEPDVRSDASEGGAPFEITTLDPRSTFVVESSSYDGRVLMSVWCGRDEDGRNVYNCMTDEARYVVKGDEVVSEAPIPFRRNPVTEYRLNNARMGVFEPVIPLLDAINSLESSRLDDIEQVVQALMVFMDCDIDADGFDEMRAKGAVKVKSAEAGARSAIELLSNPLDHSGTQTVKDDLYQAVVGICGMPNRNGASGSSSDTGAAVILRDGWTLAESHAKSYELQMKRAERGFLRACLAICRMSGGPGLDGLTIRDIELAFNRRNYENILVKSQVLTTMLASPGIHPQLAFQACGLFTDPDAAYTASMAHLAGHGGAAGAQTEPEGAALGSQAGSPEPGGNAASAASA